MRIGVAACDADGLLAYPLTTVRAGPDEVADLAALVAEHGPLEVLVGLPRSLDGGEGPAAATARDRAGRLAAAVGVPVRLVDERLTTVTAAPPAAGRRADRQAAAGGHRRGGRGGDPGAGAGVRTCTGAPAGGVSIGSWR